MIDLDDLSNRQLLMKVLHGQIGRRKFASGGFQPSSSYLNPTEADYLYNMFTPLANPPPPGHEPGQSLYTAPYVPPVATTPAAVTPPATPADTTPVTTASALDPNLLGLPGGANAPTGGGPINTVDPTMSTYNLNNTNYGASTYRSATPSTYDPKAVPSGLNMNIPPVTPLTPGLGPNSYIPRVGGTNPGDPKPLNLPNFATYNLQNNTANPFNVVSPKAGSAI